MGLMCQTACTGTTGTDNKNNNDNNTPATTIVPTQEPENSKPVSFHICPDIGSLMMCYVVKTQNNKLIVIDGGGADHNNVFFICRTSKNKWEKCS